MSAEQMISIIIFYITGSTLAVSQLTDAKQDLWISLIIGCIFALPIIFVYARILKIYPEQNLFDILIIVFGKVIGRIIIILYLFYVINLGAMLMSEYTRFVNDVSINETPIIVISLFITLIAIMIARSGVEVLGRVSHFLLPIFLFICISIFVFSMKNMDFGNVLPIMGSGIGAVTEGGIRYAALPFCELITVTMLFSSYKKGKSPYLPFFVGTAVSAVYFVLIILEEILVLGVEFSSTYYYPSYEAVSIISYGDFFTRIEVFAGVNLLISGVIKIAICILAASIGISKLFNLDDTQTLAAPVGLLVLAFSVIAFKNTEQMFELLDIYLYYTLPFQVVLPIVTLIGAEIKSRFSPPPAVKNVSSPQIPPS